MLAEETKEISLFFEKIMKSLVNDFGYDRNEFQIIKHTISSLK